MIVAFIMALSLTVPNTKMPYPHVTAICGDGTESYSLTQRGTCINHYGIVRWINYPTIP